MFVIVHVQDNRPTVFTLPQGRLFATTVAAASALYSHLAYLKEEHGSEYEEFADGWGLVDDATDRFEIVQVLTI